MRAFSESNLIRLPRVGVMAEFRRIEYGNAEISSESGESVSCYKGVVLPRNPGPDD